MRKNVVNQLILVIAVVMMAAVLPRPAGAQELDSFGSSERSTSALIGIFYDLKQNQQREPMNGRKDFGKIVDEFVSSGFDEALLNRYFRAPLPLYTTQIAMPRMSAEVAPKAFGVDGEVESRAWVVHYKGQISPPSDGVYRFVGRADDLMVVAINRQVVLDGSLGGTSKQLVKTNWQRPAPGSAPAANRSATYGSWIELKAGQPVDIDILIGEWPGGIFNAILLYEKQGETYATSGSGIVLPLFQVAPRPDGKREYLTDRPLWKCIE